MKIVSIVGTRPNFVKAYPLGRAYKEFGLQEVVVHTGQHYDFQMSRLFFEELQLPEPHYVANVPKESHAQQTAIMLTFVEAVLKEERPQLTVVTGDVDSTVAGALASAKLGIPVAHIEAGLRSNSFYNPEEINRRTADTLSHLLFPHIQEAHDSLMREGYSQDRVYLTGDVTLDAVQMIQQRCGIEPTEGSYCLVTVHRAENTDSIRRLTSIVRALIECEEKVVFPVHPRTEKKLREFGLMRQIENCKTIELLPPIGYIDFVKLMAASRTVATDSGGVRREAYILGKPVIVLLNLVWVPSMVKSGWSKIVDADTVAIVDAIRNHRPATPRQAIFGDGQAAARIAKTIASANLSALSHGADIP